jgi:elongation factor Ts
MVSELRKATGAGMMDCKKALTETAGNMEEAIDFLRKKGLSAAAKKSGRVAAEGDRCRDLAGPVGAIVEINAETDFVAKNDAFQAFVNGVREIVLANPVADVEALGQHALSGTGRTVAEELTHQIATIGENMSLRRLARIDAGEGVVTSYVHGAGKIGVLVELKTSAKDERVSELGRQIAMHVAAASPAISEPRQCPGRGRRKGKRDHAGQGAGERQTREHRGKNSGRPDQQVFR